MPADAVIDITGLGKRFGEVRAVADVSLKILEGEAFGYLGPNGAGKTTTIRAMLGFITPDEGSIRVFGLDTAKHLPHILERVGYLPGEFGLWGSMTGEDVLAYLGALHPRPPSRRDDLVERLELSRTDLARPVRTYSRGMRQKIGLIQAMQHEPELLILDEPTEGLDPVMQLRVIELLREHRARGGTTFMSSHILSEVELATDRVGVVRAGRIVRTGAARDLTGERVRHCTLTLREAAPASLLEVPGVSAVAPDTDGTRVRFEVRGEMGPLLRWLSELDVVELLSEPESLQDAFFDVYRETP